MIVRIVKSREFVLLLALAAMFIVFSIFVDGFLDWTSLLRKSRYWVATGIIAVPMTFIIATAGIDLSVGSMLALCGIVLGVAHHSFGLPIVAACFAAILMGAVLGGANGGISSYVGVPPLVVTLATMALYRGVAMGISRAETYTGFPDTFQWLGRGNLFDRIGTMGESLYLPVSVVLLAMVFVIGAVLFQRGWAGRFSEAIGENETAAAFAGIDVRRVKLGLYTACGAMCGLAAVVHTALNHTAKADTARGMELEAIACVVVGGTRISGGKGSVWGTLLGLLIIGILRHGLSMYGVKSQYQIIFVGLLLIATAVLNEWMATRAAARQ